MIRRIDYKYVVGAVFVVGLFVDLLDMTIMNVALPTLAKSFASTTSVEWVVIGYLISLAVFIPVSGWAGDRFGTKRMFTLALVIFSAGSLLGGFAWNMESLVAFRVLQGIGGGMLTPVGTAMLFRAFPPEERANASALLAIPTIVAPALGPVVGGYLVQYLSWRWIFFMNVPIGAFGLLISILFLREERQANPGRLDIPGFVLSASGLASVVYALAEAGSRGFGDLRVILFGLAGIVLLVMLTHVELHTDQPMINLRLFKHQSFTGANLFQLLGYSGFAGALYLLPLLLQFEKGVTPLQSGLATFPQALGVILMVRPAARLYKRMGSLRMIVTGMAGITATTVAFLWVDATTSLWWVALIMFLRGLPWAFIFVSLQTTAFTSIRPEDTGRASAIFNSLRQVAASFGVALLATVLTSQLAQRGARLGDPLTQAGAVAAFHDAFLVATLLGVAAILVVTLLIDDCAAAATTRPNAAAGSGRPVSQP
ncbi:MAG TPA: MDR family MFS transporter [Symbiobacteriaceae bacterium]|jgi:EmrB/QacA subfamily drug resistance transporter